MGKKFNHHFYRRWLFWFGIAFWVAEALSWSFDNWSVKLLGVAMGLFLIIWSMDGEELCVVKTHKKSARKNRALEVISDFVEQSRFGRLLTCQQFAGLTRVVGHLEGSIGGPVSHPWLLIGDARQLALPSTVGRSLG